ncbi:MAG: hypothetical protein ACMXYD_04585 [Candidatus Woesearchaeota archaeon]
MKDVDVQIIYSYMYNRELNIHRSKEQVFKRFEDLEGSCSELKELTDRFLHEAILRMEGFVEKKIPREAIRIYIVSRDRGGSFHQPMTLQYDDDQKFMFAELLHLIGHHLVTDRGSLGESKINLVVETVLDSLPLDFSRQMDRLHKNQENRYPLEYFRIDKKKYDLNEKSYNELFPPIEKDENKKKK